ncbi:MAG: phosphopyruvate hydratase [Nitrososphaerota archaeon]|nr:phosphopyruvate hydratase [Nitrososphaerota archaeon]
MVSDRIKYIHARQVLDSRGNPTVETDVRTEAGFFGRGTVPSGASTGIHEAVELRDGDQKFYRGLGVLKAVRNVNEVIAPKLVGLNPCDVGSVDRLMLDLDGSVNKGKLGANAILSVSMAVARAGAACSRVPLYRFLVEKKVYRLPVPMMNVVNGGKHAGNELSVQEFLLEPVGADSFSDALRMGSEIYHVLKEVLRDEYGVSATNVGDEGGYAPPMVNTKQPLESISKAIKKAGYDDSAVRIGMDAAASGFYDTSTKKYRIDGKILSGSELLDYYISIVEEYKINTLEDPFDEDSFEDFASITEKLGKKVMIIGDDLYVTNPERIKRGLAMHATNSVLIKLNQIGSVTETMEAVNLCHSSGLSTVVSHRSGETEDVFISHLATAVGSSFLKAGAPARGERTAKYNELLRIEEELK